MGHHYQQYQKRSVVTFLMQRPIIVTLESNCFFESLHQFYIEVILNIFIGNKQFNHCQSDQNNWVLSTPIQRPIINIFKPTGNFTYHKDEHLNILHCDHMEFVCFIWISEETANFALQNIKRQVFITELESVYIAVRTDSLYNTHTFRL